MKIMQAKNDRLSISIYRQFKSLWYTIVFILIGFGFLYYKYYSLGYFKSVLLLSVLPLFILIIPSIILHLQYYIEDKSKTVELDNERAIMIINNKKTIINLSYNKIISITKVKRTEEDFYYYNWFPWANYFYYKVKYADNEIYFITCLITNEFQITGIKNEIESSIIPFLSKKEIEIIYLKSDNKPDK